MRTFIWAVMALVFSVGTVFAQPLGGLARVDPSDSWIKDGWFSGSELRLSLTQGVPYRVFTLDDPARLVIDFAEVDFSAITPQTLLPKPGRIADVRFGTFRSGWSRLIADLEAPLLPTAVSMFVDETTGAAVLEIGLTDADEKSFASKSGAPDGAIWAARVPETASPPKPDGFVVVLDPGHGGLDPGAEREGLVEKNIALDFARVLRDLLRREGITVVMTRDADEFVSLEGRTALAHRVGAAVFISIHADALTQGGAEGATVYTLSDEASDAASEQLAARHNRGDILAGVDLTGADDEITGVLLELARRETEPRSEDLAKSIIAQMDAAGGPMNRKPWRRAGFSVLKSADIPSVLVEIGFLSSARDRKNLSDPVWRAVMASGVANGIIEWRDEDAARSGLVRQ